MAKKIQLGYKDIEERLKTFRAKAPSADEVGYRILFAFGKGERDIERYKEGKGILKTFDGLLIKGLFCYKAVETLQLQSELERLKQDVQIRKAAPKIIAVSDGVSLLAYDLREQETYENQLSRFYCDFAFFYPLMNIERIRYQEENPADVKAAEKLAKLHDELRAYNDFSSEADLHDLNIFITRLLFCFFAEDTGIFAERLFSGSIETYTKKDGSDLAAYLDAAFNIMDCNRRAADTPSVILQFPYVNGGLFAKRIQIPKMSAKARKIILECGDLDWKNINPDIFGSMIQAVVNPEVRANQGMHYTSVPNIMKVINPLFLDELRGEYNKLLMEYHLAKQRLDEWNLTHDERVVKYQSGKHRFESSPFISDCAKIASGCQKLLIRMSKMKFFDPACGSGNFLIITYKMLRSLEIQILKLLQECKMDGSNLNFIEGSIISLSQFYGIELLDFPHEVAMLSLWLAEHQMDAKFNESFGVNTNALPLHNITQIVCGNACRLDWNVVCPHGKDEEVFVFGNPPYLGSRHQEKFHKEDMEFVLHENFASLDYIACWFYKGGQYIQNSNAQCAFVTTNSICQGVQVALLWKRVLINNVAISFAHTSFKWTNNAKKNAAVTVAIVGLSATHKTKYLFSENKKVIVDNITAYLFAGKDIFVESASQPLCPNIPRMNFGNMAADNGFLLFTTQEKNDFIRKEPQSLPFFKRIYGSDEYINCKERWCLWLNGYNLQDFDNYPYIKERIEKVRDVRLNSSRPQLATTPHLFAQITQPEGINFIIIPSASSETREYIPMGYLDSSNKATNLCMVIGTEDISLFGLLTSKMHMAWVKTVGGRLETRYRYSAQLCYNTFPFPTISQAKKEEIAEAAEEVLITRELYPDKTLADLYAPDTMPQDLREAHEALDKLVDSCYPGYPFANDEARLECLFKLYEKMTQKK